MLKGIFQRYDESLKYRLTVQLLGLGIVSTLMLSVIMIYLARSTVTTNIENHLQAIRDSKIRELQSLMNSMENDIISLAQSRQMQDSVVLFEQKLQTMKVDTKKDINMAAEPLRQLDEKFQEFFDESKQLYKVRNVHLVTQSGSVVSQAEKNVFYGRNLAGDEIIEGVFAKCFSGAMKKKATVFSDLAYSTVLKRPVAYLCSPMFSKFDRDGYSKNSLMGVVIVEVLWDRFEAVTTFRAGLGETGEVYIVGQDKMLKVPILEGGEDWALSKIFSEGKQLRTPVVEKVFSNEAELSLQKGIFETTNFTHDKVFSAYALTDFMGVPWLVITEMRTDEVFDSVYKMTLFSIVLIGLMSAVLFWMGKIIGRQVGDPIEAVAVFANEISQGHLHHETEINSSDEIGRLVHSMKNMVIVIRNLVVDISMVTQKAVDGKLSARLDSNKYQGDYAAIAVGVNTLLDEVLKPSREAVHVLRTISLGDLNAKMSGSYRGENAIMKNALNATVESLKKLVVQIRDACQQMQVGVMQVNSSSVELSTGVTEQASAVEEIASTMNSIGNQSNQNAESATDAKEVAEMVNKSALVGNEQMTQMVNAMNNINGSSLDISKIIKVIDEIAFQTNLLALNAAVEAARAGRHGKGFAVVAEEVRNLAARSAKAARETAALIEDSRRKVENGMQLAKATADGLINIVDGITRVKDVMTEIAAASKDQAEGVNQVTRALHQVTQVTQKNSANSEHTASAAEELALQTEYMLQMVNKFKLESFDDAPLNSSDSEDRHLRVVVRDDDFEEAPSNMLMSFDNPSPRMASGGDSGGPDKNGSSSTEIAGIASLVTKVKVDDSDFGDF